MERAELVRRAQHGDREAFDTLVSSVLDRLYAVARLILRDADLADDATQDALIRCWRQLPRLREPERFDAWIHRLLVNAVTDEFRRRRRLRTNVVALQLEPTGDDHAGWLADRDQLRRGFERLGVEHRAIIVLHHYLGMSSSEAAATLGIPLGTAKSRLHYATEAMRAALEADARQPSAQEASA